MDIDFARDMPAPEVSRNTTFLRAAARIVATRRAADLKRGFLKLNNVNPAFAMPELDPANVSPASLLKLQQQTDALDRLRKQAEVQKETQTEIQKDISTPDAPKTPAISTISNNFQSQEKGRQQPKIPLL